MRAMLKRAYLSLVKNQLIILLSLLIVLIIKQVVLYIVLYKQANIDSKIEVSLIVSILAILIIMVLVVKQYRKLLAEENKRFVDLYLQNEKNLVTIDRLTKKNEYYEADNNSSEEEIEGVVDRVSENIYRDLKKETFLELPSLFKRICLSFEIGVGILYEEKRTKEIIKIADFDLPSDEDISYLVGEGIVGEVAESGEPILLCNLPSQYFKSFSGLGDTTPRFLQVFKVDHYIVEIASYKELRNIEIEAIATVIKNSFQKTN